ncbi:MAG: prepilin-type N-terminal cleavage/methylation domain-containing protein [Thermoanaerobaculia bacterium]
MVSKLTRKRTKSQKGFTLIEMIVVVTIIGILAGIAIVNVIGAQRKAAENVLRADLALMRKAIDDFYADRQHYPSSLQELVDTHYMRKIPVDPITKSADSWVEVKDTETPDDSGYGSGSSWGSSSSWTSSEVGGNDSGSDFQAPQGPGMIDVKSGAEGKTLDGTPYGEL